VLQGLSHLHSLKPAIIHGGLNENNVLISSREVAKITDFGNSFLATPILPSAAKRPLLEYMPPEVMRRDRCNEKVDIFSLGHLTLYIMNQQKPHLILGPTFEEQGKLIARSEVERRANHLEKMARQLDGGNTHPLSAIVTNCLSDDKDLRPSCKNILRSDFFTNPFDGNIQNAVVHPTGLTLGQGEYGKVLEVRYKTKTYAAKKYHLYPTHSSSLTPVMRMIKMRHPNILPYYGMCKLATDGSKVLVMRRIQINLTISLQRSMKLPKKVEVLNDVANGLHFLHNQTPAIIHRNLTANNVLLDVNGMARISDFADSSIVASLIHGTEDYMSPEALEGKEHNDRMDTFAFGHLSVYVIIQHRPVHLECSEHEVGGKVILRTEVERRKYHLDEMKSKL
ncbi:Probable serine/threonine-protein kinase drkB, partial [Geodia barretti]